MNNRLEMLKELQYQRLYEVRCKKRRIVLILLLLSVLSGVIIHFVSKFEMMKFEITQYSLKTDKINNDYKIVLLSDLHNHEFTEDNKNLIAAIKECAPDFVIMCGDMVIKDDPNIEVVLNLCEKIREFSEIYYILGNHEGVLEYLDGGLQIPLDKYLYEIGVTVCYPGEEYVIDTGVDEINLFSVSMTEESFQDNYNLQDKLKEFLKKDGYKILASHYPTVLYSALYNADYDLGVAGHFHGGQIIVPGLGGLYHSDTGFFPKYYAGLFKLGKAQLIVTRGLGNSSIIPRINNIPEMVLISLSAETNGK